MKMTKNFKNIWNRYYQWLCICRKNIIIFKSLLNIGVANFVRTLCSTWLWVNPLWSQACCVTILLNKPYLNNLETICSQLVPYDPRRPIVWMLWQKHSNNLLLKIALALSWPPSSHGPWSCYVVSGNGYYVSVLSTQMISNSIQHNIIQLKRRLGMLGIWQMSTENFIL